MCCVHFSELLCTIASVHLCNVDGDSSKHYSLDLRPDSDNFCAFSATFSGDNKEILAS